MSSQDVTQPSDSANRSKIHQPHKEFSHPAEVVEDATLSKREKRAALEALEQDAKQLAIASGEGMTGGEDSNLQDVLVAKGDLEQDRTKAAFASVIQALEKKLGENQASDAYGVIAHAVDALRAAQIAIENMEEIPPTPPGAAKPGSEAELEEELAKEKLDP